MVLGFVVVLVLVVLVLLLLLLVGVRGRVCVREGGCVGLSWGRGERMT